LTLQAQPQLTLQLTLQAQPQLTLPLTLQAQPQLTLQLILKWHLTYPDIGVANYFRCQSGIVGKHV
ncbi:hypothetical protein QN416_23125, partial [Glaciimonas sp. Cout2]|uniref:hypothetical protein n=1 Tax=Glaciimonas sp. Cout2 TaxID=3048621 RepID=UPI002B239262